MDEAQAHLSVAPLLGEQSVSSVMSRLNSLPPDTVSTWIIDEVLRASSYITSLLSLRNNLVPLIHRRLPNEIISMILTTAIQHPIAECAEYIGGGYLEELENLRSVMSVCSRWRSIVVNTPSCWSTIDLNNDKYAQLSLSRCRETTGLYIFLQDSLPFSGSSEASKRVLEEIERRAGQVVGMFLSDPREGKVIAERLLKHRLPRLRYVHLRPGRRQILPGPVNEVGLECQFVKSANLRVDHTNTNTDANASTFTSWYPRMTSLTLYHTIISWTSCLCSGLSSLRLELPQDEGPTMDELQEILERCPRLEMLVVKGCALVMFDPAFDSDISLDSESDSPGLRLGRGRPKTITPLGSLRELMIAHTIPSLIDEFLSRISVGSSTRISIECRNTISHSAAVAEEVEESEEESEEEGEEGGEGETDVLSILLSPTGLTRLTPWRTIQQVHIRMIGGTIQLACGSTCTCTPDNPSNPTRTSLPPPTPTPPTTKPKRNWNPEILLSMNTPTTHLPILALTRIVSKIERTRVRISKLSVTAEWTRVDPEITRKGWRKVFGSLPFLERLRVNQSRSGSRYALSTSFRSSYPSGVGALPVSTGLGELEDAGTTLQHLATALTHPQPHPNSHHPVLPSNLISIHLSGYLVPPNIAEEFIKFYLTLNSKAITMGRRDNSLSMGRRENSLSMGRHDEKLILKLEEVWLVGCIWPEGMGMDECWRNALVRSFDPAWRVRLRVADE
ncbi:hypothetical protein K474DRAFT_676389 [Panus rudis PR-1116 ss-1]|nr:hypothetical protein K474DRAFT_676389 [Panus rudis PR-1116 ss-1]